MKTFSVFALGLGVFLNSMNVQAADVKPIEPGTEAEGVAQVASSINSVFNLRTKTKAYKIVTLNSALNGSYGSTGIVMVGDDVGGEAGYEAAFQLTPTEEVTGIRSARVVGNEIEVKFSVPSDYKKTLTKRISFDTKANVLKTR
jgi:hypothetical protein